MKINSLFIVVFGVLTFFHSKAQDKIENIEIGESTIYIFRKSGFAGAAVGASIFIDYEFKCKLRNTKYLVFTLQSGEHTFYAQLYGSKPKNTPYNLTKILSINRTYYFEIFLEYNSNQKVIPLNLREISEKEADEMLEKTSEETNCKDVN